MPIEQMCETADRPHSCAVCGKNAIYRRIDVEYDTHGLATGGTITTYICSNHVTSPVIINQTDCFGICSPDHCDWPTCKDWTFAKRAGKLFARTVGVEIPAGADWIPEPDRGNPV